MLTTVGIFADVRVMPVKLQFENFNFSRKQFKPENQWSCKRSPDILAKQSTKHTKPEKIYGKEMTLTFNTHIPS